MGTKYGSQSQSGYNASPPSDNGAATESNKVKWSSIKTKLSDPLKTLAEAINTALVTALDLSPRSVSGGDTAGSSDHWKTIQVNSASVTITLSDAATMAAGYMVSVANQSSGDITVALATATDTLDTVTNTTQTISAKEVRTYIVNSSTNGYITVSDRSVAASDTIDGTIEIATQAEQETGTDTTRAVTPGRQHYHQSAAKGWVAFDAAGTINASYNVTSITDSGTGDLTVNWATDFSSATFCPVVTARKSDATTVIIYVAGSLAAGTTRVVSRNSAFATMDADEYYVVAFGDQ